MKSVIQKSVSLMLVIMFGITAISCGGKEAAPTWQEQYDLGVRFLSEGNYEEAIIAFNAAIEIDPKQVDAWLGLSEAYLLRNDLEQALAVLRDALDVTGDTKLSDRIADIEVQLQQLEEEQRAVAMEMLASCPYIGDRSQWKMSAEQAEAYAQVIRNAALRVENGEWWGDEADKDIYTTLADVDGNTILWICGIAIYDREAEWPDDIAFGHRSFNIMFEEVWEWDGNQAFEFTPVSEFNANVKLRSNGLDIFINYAGTDVDGEAWDALYPFTNGKISNIPEWCRAWEWVYSYKLDDYGIEASGMSNSAVAQALVNEFVSRGLWPALPFDWNTLSLFESGWDDSFRAELSGGTGYEEFYESEYGGYDWPWPDQPSGELLSSGDIVAQDGRWDKAENVVGCLVAYADVF